MNRLLYSILVIIIVYCIYVFFIQKKMNSYIGVNMNCVVCNEIKGSHSHSLDKLSMNNKNENKALSGERCPVCKQNPGSLHTHFMN